MPTTKKRINLTTDKDTEAILERIAKRDGVPMATKAAELIAFCLGNRGRRCARLDSRGSYGHEN